MISSITYNGDGVTRVFPVSFEIKGEAYVVIYLNNVAVSDMTKYDIINNSIVFVEGQAPIVGVDNVQIVVASTPTEIADLNAPPSSVQTVLDNLVNITAVAEDLGNIDTVAGSIASINSVNTNIVPNLAEILQADTNATIATDKAAEALVSANNASLSETAALASENKAYAWSSTPEDTQVESGLYSALHWANKAQEYASTVDTSNFVNRTTDQSIGGVKTFNSFPITPSSAPTTSYQVVNKAYTDSFSYVNSASSKTTPVDDDEFGIVDSASSNVLKKLTLSNLKATIISSFGVMVSALTAKTTPVPADILMLGDSASSFTSKKLSFNDLTAYFDTFFSRTTAIFGIGQTCQDLIASRAVNTVYTNSTGKTIIVIFVTTSGAFNYTIKVAGDIIGDIYLGSSGYRVPITFPVQNGATYEVYTSGGSGFIWSEYR